MAPARKPPTASQSATGHTQAIQTQPPSPSQSIQIGNSLRTSCYLAALSSASPSVTASAYSGSAIISPFHIRRSAAPTQPRTKTQTDHWVLTHMRCSASAPPTVPFRVGAGPEMLCTSASVRCCSATPVGRRPRPDNLQYCLA